MKRKAIVFDIDNTLLDVKFIDDYLDKSTDLRSYEKLDYFYQHCNGDNVRVIKEVKHFLDILKNSYCIVRGMYENRWQADESLFQIIISTARSEKYREETVEKLNGLGIYFNQLYMRDRDDYREPCEVKKDHLIEIMKDYDVIAFIDDDLQNCEMAKELGILALRRV